MKCRLRRWWLFLKANITSSPNDVISIAMSQLKTRAVENLSSSLRRHRSISSDRPTSIADSTFVLKRRGREEYFLKDCSIHGYEVCLISRKENYSFLMADEHVLGKKRPLRHQSSLR